MILASSFNLLNKRCLIILTFFLFRFVGCLGQVPIPTYYLSDKKELNQYNIRYFTRKEGLPTNSLLGICQTSDAYLWLASYDGLIRFDGEEFFVFDKHNTEVFKTNTVRSLSEDSNGTLWLTSLGNGLLSYKNGKFVRYGLEQGIDQLYSALYIDEENRIWSASPEKGWFSFKDGKFSYIEYEQSLLNVEVRAITSSEKGVIWWGTFGKGLFRYQNGKLRQFTSKNGLVNDWVYSLYYDSQGILWIGTSSGISFYNGQSIKPLAQFSGVTITDILEDRYGNLWFASSHGIFRKKKGTDLIECLNSENGINHEYVNDILFDKEGNLWLAFYKGGIAQLKDGKFTNYTNNSGLDGKVVNAICEIDNGRYLTAFDNGRLNLISDGKISPYQIKTDIGGERIRHILKDDNSNLWISTYKGLLRISSNGEEKWFNKQTGFPHSKIRLSFEDSNGNIWVGTRNNGLIRINKDNSYKLFSVANGLSANLIMSIDEDRNGNVLVGTSEGESSFNIIKGDKVTVIDKEKGFFSSVVFNTYTDKDGIVWIATQDGLFVYYNDMVNFLSVKDGMVVDAFFDVLEDGYGFLWLPCSKGVMRLNKKSVFQYLNKEITQIECRLFDEHDGMFESECNPTAQSLVASNGQLLFPTINGIATIDPQKIPSNNFIPPVIIKSVVTDKETVKLGADLQFSSDIKRFTFNYTAVSLYESEEIKFQYLLEGFDDNWVDAGSSRSISYTNLDPGEYTFYVKACNNDDIWSKDLASLSFTVLPKFTQSFVFYLILFFALVGAIYVLLKIRIKKLENYQERLERIIDERTREVQDKNKALAEQNAEIETQTEFLESQKRELNKLNSSKDKMLSIIAHDLRGPLGNFKAMVDMMITAQDFYNKAEQIEMLQLLSQNANATYELLENLLNWSGSQRGVITFEPSQLEVLTVVMEVNEFILPMATKKNISVFYEIGEEIQVYADENMFRAILRNLIGNAIKFTRERGEIIFSAVRKGDQVIFGVKDNGVGMLPEVKEKLFNQLENTIKLGTNSEKGSGLGLLLCKEFIEKMGGEIWVESEIGKGSTFFFSLSANN